MNSPDGRWMGRMPRQPAEYTEHGLPAKSGTPDWPNAHNLSVLRLAVGNNPTSSLQYRLFRRKRMSFLEADFFLLGERGRFDFERRRGAESRRPLVSSTIPSSSRSFGTSMPLAPHASSSESHQTAHRGGGAPFPDSDISIVFGDFQARALQKHRKNAVAKRGKPARQRSKQAKRSVFYTLFSTRCGGGTDTRSGRRGPGLRARCCSARGHSRCSCRRRVRFHLRRCRRC